VGNLHAGLILPLVAVRGELFIYAVTNNESTALGYAPTVVSGGYYIIGGMGLIFEIRVCVSCGLRYPATEGNTFGVRCPGCLGETNVVLRKEIAEEDRSRTEPAGGRKAGLSVLVDNVRSAWNVGSILRTADGFGFSHAYLCGVTPTPDVEGVQKTSLGAEEYVTWSYHKDAVRLVKGLKKEGWKIVVLEEGEDATDIRKFKIKKKEEREKTVLIVGSEATGVDPGLLELCDEILFIPMYGQKKSFNVAVAFGIAAYALAS
jgi:tRNA(Leu) C34 or U34 (ribose-2'-O)-methylase TrmL